MAIQTVRITINPGLGSERHKAKEVASILRGIADEIDRCKAMPANGESFQDENGTTVAAINSY